MLHTGSGERERERERELKQKGNIKTRETGSQKGNERWTKKGLGRKKRGSLLLDF
jgi:hypothetical protein